MRTIDWYENESDDDNGWDDWYDDSVGSITLYDNYDYVCMYCIL